MDYITFVKRAMLNMLKKNNDDIVVHVILFL